MEITAPHPELWSLIFIPIGAALGGWAMVHDAARRSTTAVVIDLTKNDLEPATTAWASRAAS
jgi:hypothetical protein